MAVEMTPEADSNNRDVKSKSRATDLAFVFMALNAHASRTSTRQIVESIMRATGGLNIAHL
jgi:hypothetical protein